MVYKLYFSKSVEQKSNWQPTELQNSKAENLDVSLTCQSPSASVSQSKSVLLPFNYEEILERCGRFNTHLTIKKGKGEMWCEQRNKEPWLPLLSSSW